VHNGAAAFEGIPYAAGTMALWNWMRRPSPPPVTPPVLAAPESNSPVPRGRLTAGRHRPLHDYLRDRFADSVVLTFDQIEDLLGSSLPHEARSDAGWWDGTTGIAGDAHCSDAWVLAKRTARPNLRARTVIFDRIA
jgi:hypothetical protein